MATNKNLVGMILWQQDDSNASPLGGCGERSKTMVVGMILQQRTKNLVSAAKAVNSTELTGTKLKMNIPMEGK